jgi:hypothetical protein
MMNEYYNRPYYDGRERIDEWGAIGRGLANLGKGLLKGAGRGLSSIAKGIGRGAAKAAPHVGRGLAKAAPGIALGAGVSYGVDRLMGRDDDISTARDSYERLGYLLRDFSEAINHNNELDADSRSMINSLIEHIVATLSAGETDRMDYGYGYGYGDDYDAWF